MNSSARCPRLAKGSEATNAVCGRLGLSGLRTKNFRWKSGTCARGGSTKATWECRLPDRSVFEQEQHSQVQKLSEHRHALAV